MWKDFVAYQLPALSRNVRVEMFIRQLISTICTGCTDVQVLATCHANLSSERGRRKLSLVTGRFWTDTAESSTSLLVVPNPKTAACTFGVAVIVPQTRLKTWMWRAPRAQLIRIGMEPESNNLYETPEHYSLGVLSCQEWYWARQSLSFFMSKQRLELPTIEWSENESLGVCRWLPDQFLKDSKTLTLPGCVSTVFWELRQAMYLQTTPGWALKLPGDDMVADNGRQLIGSLMRWIAALIAEQVERHEDLVHRQAICQLRAKPEFGWPVQLASLHRPDISVEMLLQSRDISYQIMMPEISATRRPVFSLKGAKDFLVGLKLPA